MKHMKYDIERVQLEKTLIIRDTLHAKLQFLVKLIQVIFYTTTDLFILFFSKARWHLLSE